MPPKGWKKKDTTTPAAAAAPAAPPKAVAKKTPLPPKTASAPTQNLEHVFAQVSAVLGTLTAQRVNLVGSQATGEVVEAADEAITNAIDHLDRLRAALPYGVEVKEELPAAKQELPQTAATQPETPRPTKPTASPAPFAPAGFAPAVPTHQPS